MELVGREREIAVLDGALEDVRNGTPRTLGVLGEAGIGKSALLDAISGITVLSARGAEHERDVPFGVLAAALDADDLVADGVSAAERFLHHRALRRRLETFGRPVALVLDDLHWADDATVEFVLHLLRRAPSRADPARVRAATGPDRDARARRRARGDGLRAARARPARPRGVADTARRRTPRGADRPGGPRQPAVPERTAPRDVQRRAADDAARGGRARSRGAGAGRAHAARRRRRRRRPVRPGARGGRRRTRR